MPKRSFFVLFFLLASCLGAQEKPLSPEDLLAMLNEGLPQMPVFEDLQQDVALLSNEQDREFLLEALQNPEVLNDAVLQQRCDMLMDRLNTLKLIRSLQSKVQDAVLHAKLSYWLNEQDLLDDENVKKELEKIVVMVEKESIAFAQKLNQAGDVAQDALVISYTIYRKFRLLRALEAGAAITGLQKTVDWCISWLYLGLGAFRSFGKIFQQYRLMEKYKREGDIEKAQAYERMMMSESMLQPTMNALAYSGEMNEDDYARFVDKKIMVEARRRFANQALPENVQEREQAVREAVAEQIKQAVPSKTLDFFDTFDLYLDRRLEQRINTALVKLKIPQSMRWFFMSNTGVRFIREIMIFKMLPTAVYWYGTRLWAGTLGNEHFTSSNLLREATKSAGNVAEKRAVSFFVGLANGQEDANGLGRLDRMKRNTLGIVGPNLVKLGGKLLVPQLMLALLGKQIEGQEGREQFLEPRDYYLHPDRPFTSRVAKKSSKYLVGSVTSFVALKLLKKIRIKCGGWFGNKLKSLADFLVRRGWLSADLVETTELAGIFGQQLGMPLLLLAYNFFWHDNLLTRFDQAELQLEIARTGDQFLFFDYLLAAWIGKAMGKKVTGMLEDRGVIAG